MEFITIKSLKKMPRTCEKCIFRIPIYDSYHCFFMQKQREEYYYWDDKRTRPPYCELEKQTISLRKKKRAKNENTRNDNN